MCRLNTKKRLTMLCLSGFELYSRWVPLILRLLRPNLLLKAGSEQLTSFRHLFLKIYSSPLSQNIMPQQKSYSNPKYSLHKQFS